MSDVYVYLTKDIPEATIWTGCVNDDVKVDFTEVSGEVLGVEVLGAVDVTVDGVPVIPVHARDTQVNEFDRRGCVLTIIAEAHNRSDRNGRCRECRQPSPCPTHLWAAGYHASDADWDDAPRRLQGGQR